MDTSSEDNVSNFSASQWNEDWPETPGALNATIIIVLGTLITIVNMWTLLVTRSYKHALNPNVLISCLALIACISSLIICPIIAYVYLANNSVSTVVCDVFDSLWTCYQLVSTFVVTLMVIDRYMAIRKPIFYRTHISGVFLKYIIASAVVITIPLCFTPVLVLYTAYDVNQWREAAPYPTCVGLHNRYFHAHRIVILIINFTCFAVGMFCYFSFLLGVRNFVHRWSVRFANQNSSLFDQLSTQPATSCHQCRCRCRCLCFRRSCCFREEQNKTFSREELVEKTLQLMKSLHVKRCTRISKTIGVAAGLYYVPWVLCQASMTYKLITDNHSPLFDYILIRLVLAGSILNPVVYAGFSKYYRQGYRRVLAAPLRRCGYELRDRQPLGLSGSEMQRITHRMALEEWESPGLIRRQYSKRQTKKRRAPYRSQHVYTVSEDTSSTMAGAENQAATTPREVTGPRLYRKYHETDTKSKVITTIDAGVVQGSGELPEPSGSNSDRDSSRLQDVSEDVPTTGSNLDESLTSESADQNSKQRGKPMPACFKKVQLEQRLSDSGVDTESIFCESLPSGGNSPNVARMDTVEIPLTVYDVRNANQSGNGLFDGGVKKYTAKASVLESPALSDAVAKDHVRVHVEVIEIVDSSAVKRTDGSLVSTVRQCQIPKESMTATESDVRSPSPSFVFSLLENRFVPDKRGEEIDTYSCRYDEDNTPHCTVTTCTRDAPKAPIKSDKEREIDDSSSSPSTSGLKKTSQVLRDSSRYSDDITILNDLIIQGLEHNLRDHTAV